VRLYQCDERDFAPLREIKNASLFEIIWVQSLYYDKDRNISGKLENLAK